MLREKRRNTRYGERRRKAGGHVEDNSEERSREKLEREREEEERTREC